MAKHAVFGSISLALACAFAVATASFGKAAQQTAGTKLVSFAPSNTELLYSIGAADKLIGVCSYCDFPAAVKQKTVVGNFISANLERLASLKPDKIFLVSGQEALAGQLAHHGYKVIVLKNNHLSDVAKNLKELGVATGRTASGEQTAAAFDKCVSDLSAVTSKAPTKPTVFYCVWPQPLLTIGKSYLTDAITVCGGESISDKLEAGYPHFSLEKLVLANPDVIVMPFECKDREFLKKHPWSTLKAVKNDKVFFLPDPHSDGLARPTLRLSYGLFWLAKRIHPELSYRLDGWLAQSQNSLHSISAATAPGSSPDRKQPN